MEPERDEVYERIPWESLEKRGGDRQWLVYAVAAALVLGALAYSFMRNQPTAPPPTVAAATTVPAPTVAATADSTVSTALSTVSTIAGPLVVAEADLYAVEPERLVDQASGHAEWFAVEYISRDGSRTSDDLLASLLPAGLPVPEAPRGAQVFVDWARAIATTQTGPVSFEVEVLVRSLAANGDEGFVRQDPRSVLVGIEIGADGLARVTGIPRIDEVEIGENAASHVEDLPDDVADRLGVAADDVLGGVHTEDGWVAVVMAEGEDGVRRPVGVTP